MNERHSSYNYIRSSGIRKLVKDNGKRCGKDFLGGIDRIVYEMVLRAIKVHNGGKVTLDAATAAYVSGRERGIV